jgi:hypothetical protein
MYSNYYSDERFFVLIYAPEGRAPATSDTGHNALVCYIVISALNKAWRKKKLFFS